MASESIKKELLNLEKRFWQAIQDQDVDTATELSDEFSLLTGPQGVSCVTRNEMKQMMNSASYTLDEFEILEQSAQASLLSDDVAVLAYKVREKLTVEGKPVDLEASESSTWVRRNGRWVCASHSEALIGDPFGRDRQRDPQSEAA